MYKYDETPKHHLTPELIIHDLKEDSKGSAVFSGFMLIVSPLAALVATGFIQLLCATSGDFHPVFLNVLTVVVWVVAAAAMVLFAAILRSARKPMKASDFHVVKRRLATIARDEYITTHYHGGGRSHTVRRDVFYFEGMDRYIPNQTELALAEEGDEYFIVTYEENSKHAVRIYRADAYIWNG
ncbi:MAG: hypothetical protein IJX72_00865 [Clostridia bacterium]|nr:hypothetical protein [Clostridia bacterium]